MSVSDLVVLNERNEIVPADIKGLQLMRDALYPDVTDLRFINMTLLYCKKYKVDFFQRLFHIVNRGTKSSPNYVVWSSIQLLRELCGRVGLYGLSDPLWLEPMNDELTVKEYGTNKTYSVECHKMCKMTLTRVASGLLLPVTGFALWKESKKNSKIWLDRPDSQLSKCTEADTLRKATHGIPYLHTIEEMEGTLEEEPAGPRTDIVEEIKAKVKFNKGALSSAAAPITLRKEESVYLDSLNSATISTDTLKELNVMLSCYVPAEGQQSWLKKKNKNSFTELTEEEGLQAIASIKNRYEGKVVNG